MFEIIYQYFINNIFAYEDTYFNQYDELFQAFALLMTLFTISILFVIVIKLFVVAWEGIWGLFT